MIQSDNNKKIFIAAIQQLPPLMRAVINNPALIENMIAIAEQYELTPKQQDDLMAIERAVIIQQLPVGKVPSEIQQLGVASKNVNGLIQDFLGRIVMPMSWHVGSVDAVIQQLGGRTEEYLYHARRQFPEVYTPQLAPSTENETTETEHPLLRNFDDKVETPRGRADILLRLTGLASQIDEMMNSEAINQAEGEELLRSLDTLSYAINTKDLNPLEIQSLKRRLRKVLGRLSESIA